MPDHSMPSDMPPFDTRPVLHICTTCRAGLTLTEGEIAPGQTLHDAVAGLLGPHAPVQLRPVVCLASCDHGCAAAISQPGKWSYLLGGLTAETAPDLLTYGAAYAASRTGAVLPSRRPASPGRAVLGRFPAQEPGHEPASAPALAPVQETAR